MTGPRKPLYKSVIVDVHQTIVIPAKIYLVDSRGRKNPRAYEWDASLMNQDEIVENLIVWMECSDSIGIPHIAISFPHITKFYRFGDPRIGEHAEEIYRLEPTLNTRPLNRRKYVSSKSKDISLGEEDIISREAYFRANSTPEEYFWKFVEVGSVLANPNFLEGKI